MKFMEKEKKKIKKIVIDREELVRVFIKTILPPTHLNVESLILSLIPKN